MISAEELAAVLGDDSEVKTIISEADANKDGELSFEEFKTLMVKLGQQK